jgi:DNA repair exonuclease SbcCD nuclease subunit
MSFKFIHTADWQIDKPFGTIGAEKAAVLRQARLDVIGRIAGAARERGIAHVLVAGDVFDSSTAPVEVARRLMAALKAQGGIHWHLLPGNHDPAQAKGVWDRVAAAGAPGNVTLHLAPAIAEIAPGVALLPAPLTQKAMATDPTAWMDRAETAPGVIRIGLAHGSVQGFSGDGDAAVPIAPDRDRRARLDYVALGDWHGTTRIGDRTWYAGTPEMDRFPDNEPGHVLAVTIGSSGATPVIERITTSAYRWTRRAMTLTSASRLEPLEAEIAALGPEALRVLIELSIDGRLTLADHAALKVRLARLGDSVFWLSVKDKALQVSAGDEDLAALGDGPLRTAAERLKAIAEANGAEAPTAKRALLELAELAARDGRAA